MRKFILPLMLVLSLGHLSHAMAKPQSAENSSDSLGIVPTNKLNTHCDKTRKEAAAAKPLSSSGTERVKSEAAPKGTTDI
jgi:hypothetical protein